jgi:hypothetical protein
LTGTIVDWFVTTLIKTPGSARREKGLGRGYRTREHFKIAALQPHIVAKNTAWHCSQMLIYSCSKGIGIWDWASTDDGAEPDVILACAGDIATMESVEAAAILKEHFPDLKVRFVNVVDLFRLMPSSEIRTDSWTQTSILDSQSTSLSSSTFIPTRRSFTSSATAARFMTTFMCADTRKKATASTGASSATSNAGYHCASNRQQGHHHSGLTQIILRFLESGGSDGT